jgi:hypothetical protein
VAAAGCATRHCSTAAGAASCALVVAVEAGRATRALVVAAATRRVLVASQRWCWRCYSCLS